MAASARFGSRVLGPSAISVCRSIGRMFGAVAWAENKRLRSWHAKRAPRQCACPAHAPSLLLGGCRGRAGDAAFAAGWLSLRSGVHYSGSCTATASRPSGGAVWGPGARWSGGTAVKGWKGPPPRRCQTSPSSRLTAGSGAAAFGAAALRRRGDLTLTVFSSALASTTLGGIKVRAVRLVAWGLGLSGDRAFPSARLFLVGRAGFAGSAMRQFRFRSCGDRSRGHRLRGPGRASTPVDAADRWRLDLVVHGTTASGVASCCDATPVSSLSRDGRAQARAADCDGAALRAAEQRACCLPGATAPGAAPRLRSR